MDHISKPSSWVGYVWAQSKHEEEGSNALLQVWGAQIPMPTSISQHSRQPSYQSSLQRVPLTPGAIDEKSETFGTTIRVDESVEEVYDPESDAVGPAKRPMVLTHSFMVGLAMILVVVVEIFCIGNVSFANDVESVSSLIFILIATD
jgi:hypothetical protein